MKLQIKEGQIIFRDDENVVLLKSETPILAELWDGNNTERIWSAAAPYTEILKNGAGIKAYGIIQDPEI